MDCAKPQTVEISSPLQYKLGVLSSLTLEKLRVFSAEQVYKAAVRRIPHETHIDSQEKLNWEHNESLALQGKQLKADPRAKPDDLVVDLKHLDDCIACRQHIETQQLIHNDKVNISDGWQLLADDYTVQSWRNLLRSLTPPESQKTVLKPKTRTERRFGCPCSVLYTKGKHFRLYHTAGSLAGNKSSNRYSEWPRSYLETESRDGLTDWSKPKRLQLDGYSYGSLTGSFTASRDSGIRGDSGGEGFVAGYEGANSRVCLAHSKDGSSWTTMPTGAKISFQSRAGLAVPWQTVKRISTRRKRPPHLMDINFMKSLPGISPKMFMMGLTRRKSPVRRACDFDLEECKRMGFRFRSVRAIENTTKDDTEVTTPDQPFKSGRISSCMLRRFESNNMSKACRALCNLDFLPRLGNIDCIDSSHSELGRAGDCNIQPIYDVAAKRQLVWYRRDFGTQGGWREIRGVQVASVAPRISNHASRMAGKPLNIERVGSYYLDRLGKGERFRRQIYSVTFTRHGNNLWLGLMTLIEWAKDSDEAVGDHLPAFQRDTTSIYLVTSRDGIHVDDEWVSCRADIELRHWRSRTIDPLRPRGCTCAMQVYARRPLVPKGKLQGDWNSGTRPLTGLSTPPLLCITAISRLC